MFRKLVLTLCLILFSVAIVGAQVSGANVDNADNANDATDVVNGADVASDSDAKTLKGMSVLGNNEAPMSLFIVPWKSSELGADTDLHRTLNERDVPVDRDVFKRELEFYQVSVAGKNPVPTADHNP